MTTLAAVVLFFGAAVCFLFGAKLLMDAKQKNAACTAPAMAELLRYDEEVRTDTDDDVNGDVIITKVTLHYPVFQYQAEGALREVRLSNAMSKDTWAIGALVPIQYDPKQPEKFMIAGDKNTSVLGAVILAAGLLCLVFGIAMLRAQ